MPQQVGTSVENNFTKGFVTEFTALNFPENAATAADNTAFSSVGDVSRRLGIDYEVGYNTAAINRASSAVVTYRWTNAGGDGETQLIVTQVGTNLYFYRSSAATTASPVSTKKLSSVISLSTFATGTSPDPALYECEFANGNGYLFVYHPRCQPFFCSFDGTTVTATQISVNIRDFNGVLEPGVDVATRPTTLTSAHLYNLTNQGWIKGSPWTSSSLSSVLVGTGSKVFNVSLGLPVTLGELVQVKNEFDAYPGGVYVPAGTVVMSGTVTGYSVGVLTVSVTGTLAAFVGSSYGNWVIASVSKAYLDTWNTAIGNYPSNADVWWRFKNTSGVFDPTNTINSVTIASGNAPRGHYIMDAFNQNKSLISAASGLTSITTSLRPRTGTWFQGRVWYTGVDAVQTKTGTADFYSWSSNIYFSQVAVGPEQFGMCHQLNDPTSEDLFDLLPTDGGTITIQDAGAIYKLFPIQNGLLVFASNGVWFITGSQGIGFAANDYTVTKISSVKSISGTSFVDVLGLPYFWNEDGVYAVTPSEGGSLSVSNLTITTIDSYFATIPITSKRYARGVYDPINHIVQWIFKSSSDLDSVTKRYEFDNMLNFNTWNKAFFGYSITGDPATVPQINSIVYISYPGSSSVPAPSIKYYISKVNGSTYDFTFGDEHSESYLDWETTGSQDFTSYFVTGYRLRGQASKKFNSQYLNVYSRTDGEAHAYKIQGIWDYSNSGNSGRWSNEQLITTGLDRFDTKIRRHKIRGRGYALQFKITSVSGLPFRIHGWAAIDTINAGA